MSTRRGRLDQQRQRNAGDEIERRAEARRLEASTRHRSEQQPCATGTARGTRRGIDRPTPRAPGSEAPRKASNTRPGMRDDGKRKAPKRAVHSLEAMRKNSGSDLLSHNVTVAVPSAPKSLTSEFGMGSGGTSSISPPENLGLHRNPNSATERILRERLAEGGRTSSILPLRHDQASRPISTSQLRALQRFHPWPINLVVYKGS